MGEYDDVWDELMDIRADLREMRDRHMEERNQQDPQSVMYHYQDGVVNGLREAIAMVVERLPLKYRDG